MLQLISDFWCLLLIISGAYFGFSSESLVIVSDPVGNSNARFGSSGILESDSDLFSSPGVDSL